MGTYLEDLWERSYQEVHAYKTHFGHCDIPITYVANPSLGAWAFSQRMAYKRNKLSEDRVEKLNKLGFSFGPQEDVPSSGVNTSWYLVTHVTLLCFGLGGGLGIYL